MDDKKLTFLRNSIAPDKIVIALSRHKGYYRMDYNEHIPVAAFSPKKWKKQVELIKKEVQCIKIDGHWVRYSIKRSEMLPILCGILMEGIAVMNGKEKKSQADVEKLLAQMEFFTKYCAKLIRKHMIE